ncbi:hypothetical protein X771_15085 [Mesorhizobium sp. LSJC277A00]|nr:hypothetical protein X771_15085 [Mesorhizobium sp. LSJC277A00]ESZ50862.1 hypothetical protein X730_05670 [Mesorhizobium sp. L103C565B0]
MQDDSFGEINLDYDAVTLDAKMPAERFFELIRSDLGSLLVQLETNISYSNWLCLRN